MPNKQQHNHTATTFKNPNTVWGNHCKAWRWYNTAVLLGCAGLFVYGLVG